MRNIINISLPPELNAEVEKAVKKGRYASKSEFIRHLLRTWKEEQILKEIRESEKDFKEGRWKTIKSAKELRSAKF